MSWLYPGVHVYGNLYQVLFLASHLPQVIKDEDRTELGEEFMNYCTSELPPDFGPASANEMDTYWHRVSQDAYGKLRYPLLTQLAKAVLIVPHGNADIERMFSHMGLNKTKLRNSLGIETLTALLQLQVNIKEPCFSFKPTPQKMARCKNVISALSE